MTICDQAHSQNDFPFFCCCLPRMCSMQVWEALSPSGESMPKLKVSSCPPQFLPLLSRISLIWPPSAGLCPPLPSYLDGPCPPFCTPFASKTAGLGTIKGGSTIAGGQGRRPGKTSLGRGRYNNWGRGHGAHLPRNKNPIHAPKRGDKCDGDHRCHIYFSLSL